MSWKQITEERADEMFGVVPPVAVTPYGFLMGEPMDHNAEGRTLYMAIVYPLQKGGPYLESLEPMTVADWRALELAAINPIRAAGV